MSETSARPRITDQELLVTMIKRTSYFRSAMKEAFFHGRNFEQSDSEGKEIDLRGVEDKNLPFHEWMARKYPPTNPPTQTKA